MSTTAYSLNHAAAAVLPFRAAGTRASVLASMAGHEPTPAHS